MDAEYKQNKIVICTCNEIVADGVSAPDGFDAEIASEYYRNVTNVLVAAGYFDWDIDSNFHHWRGGRYGNPQQCVGYIYVRGEITPELRAVLEQADAAGCQAMETERASFFETEED